MSGASDKAAPPSSDIQSSTDLPTSPDPGADAKLIGDDEEGASRLSS